MNNFIACLHYNYIVIRLAIKSFGELAEWLKAHAWKACKGLSLSRVRISRSPPYKKPLIYQGFFVFIHTFYSPEEFDQSLTKKSAYFLSLGKFIFEVPILLVKIFTGMTRDFRTSIIFL